MNKKMKKILIIVLIIIVLISLIILSIFFFKDYFKNQLYKNSPSFYYFDLLYKNETQDLGYSGYYENQKIIFSDENSNYEYALNLYSYFLPYIENDVGFGTKTIEKNLNFAELINKNAELEKILNTKNTMNCKIDITDYKIYSITCNNDSESMYLYF